MPGVALAQISGSVGKPGQSAPAEDPKPVETPQPGQDATVPAPDEKPIVSDEEFEKALPPLSDDMNAPLEPMAPAPPPADATAETPGGMAPLDAEQPLGQGENETELAAPLPPLSEFDTTPIAEAMALNDGDAVEIRYATRVTGLKEIGLEGQFRELSALEDGDGKAANAAIIGARAREDEALAVRLMKSLGYYDATAAATVDQPAAAGQPTTATIAAVPGALYKLGRIDIQADPTVPPSLIADNFQLRTGEPIDAVRVQAAEAAVSVALPQNGYPFAEVGQRDILLDETAQTGDYSLPVTVGPRARFRSITTEGKLAFDAKHVEVLTRFDRDDLYDSRMVDDLRDALIATSLFSTVSVEPVKTGEAAAEGTEYVDLLVRQQAGPPRTLAGELGFSTGQGLRAEVSWTHRNLFPPEGALILSGVAGTQEQGASATFRRSNAGRRDRTFQLIASALRTDVEAFTGLTGTLSAQISYDSTPIWQKELTYSYGVELVGTSEDRYDFNRGARERGVYFIAALPLFAGWDKSDNLLNPTRGYRVKLNLSPETSVRGGTRPYARAMLEGTAYYPVTDSIVLAGRARFGTIQGIDRNALAPSRRYYAGGGGSVRGFGYQELGPRAPDGKPIGGRSFNEFAIEARYRFGNFGIVPFVDAGQVYESGLPKLTDMRFGFGIGGRMYTNFGPLRLDVATPINRKPGESKIALYISIGQAF
ncbi:BamA/TamA family outer membrane protein [Sphingomonas sp. BT-65]|uniref:autotransporter assembly complex protein TamA n=1 Tax=Sphingomonas sp. BT-65 TaxID=2989821 RepID=UPI0022359B90|nr:BamA/TamA family outer membrane protein [Sphingomonas sp. BT-65]MCW4463598.1 BamA/TamA family outer membrane protein [Sphingomonas sp. BT-65]